jgi:hypothetical protein
MNLRGLDTPSAPTNGTYAADVPRVLVITAHRWLTTTRLALALFEAGFTVEALCPTGHSLGRVSFVSKTYPYRALSPIRSLRDAIEASQPDLLIPSDDYSVARLHQLYALTQRTYVAADDLRSLIERSLGDPEHYPILYARDQIASLARSLGVICPASAIVSNEEDLLLKLNSIGFPAVLKTDGSWGGEGVAIVHDLANAKRAFQKLDAPPSSVRMLKRLIIDRDANLVIPSLSRLHPSISIQRFVEGKPANAAVACCRGEVLAQVIVEVLATRYANGPATVVNLITHPGISQTVELVSRRLKLSGLCGFDFILDPNGNAHMIELNPRATPTCHLVSSDGKQLLVSLAAMSRRLPDVGNHGVPVYGPIALFPHGIGYDPKSSYLPRSQNDLPWQSPELLNIGFRSKESFLTRFIRSCVKRSDLV